MEIEIETDIIDMGLKWKRNRSWHRNRHRDGIEIRTEVRVDNDIGNGNAMELTLELTLKLTLTSFPSLATITWSFLPCLLTILSTETFFLFLSRSVKVSIDI